MAISEQLQKRIQNLTGQMTPGSAMADTDVMDIVGQSKGAISDREMDAFGPSATKSLDDELKARGMFDSGLSTQMKRNRLNMDMINQFKGAISNKELDTNMKTAPEMTMDMIGQSKGAISDREMEMFMNSSPELSPEKIKILEGIELLQKELSMTQDPEERLSLENIIKQSIARVNAPLGDLATALASQGTDEDKILAHLTPNEVVLPEEFFEDPEFESVVERKFAEYNLNPELAVVGSGIATLNANTGLEEFGFFKKVFKAAKKVVKKVAPIAAVIPGPWQPFAAVYQKGSAAVKLAKGEGGIGDILSLAAGGNQKLFGDSGALSKIGSGTGITSAASWGDALKNVGSVTNAAGKSVFNPLQYGTNVLRSKASDLNQGLGGLFGGGTGGYFDVNTGMMTGGVANPIGATTFDPSSGTYTDSLGNTFTQSAGGTFTNTGAGGGGLFNGIFGGGGNLGNILGGGPAGGPAGGPISGSSRSRGGGFFGGGSRGGFGSGFGNIAKTGLLGLGAYKLGKLAFDEAKDAKGVPLVPLTTMDAAGRYDIEAEIARRMGQSAPNPVEFGLLPTGTIPELSGGMAQGGAVMPMAYAEGGGVAMEDFQRMNGEIDGPGSETSDDIPAMLSDGEFVMTGQAVRGAGAFDMQNDGGIITLTPNGAEDRDRGTNLMYEMMSLFESQGAS